MAYLLLEIHTFHKYFHPRLSQIFSDVISQIFLPQAFTNIFRCNFTNIFTPGSAFTKIFRKAFHKYFHPRQAFTNIFRYTLTKKFWHAGFHKYEFDKYFHPGRLVCQQSTQVWLQLPAGLTRSYSSSPSS